jgi:tetratricopeptide (TPR) repeat protein
MNAADIDKAHHRVARLTGFLRQDPDNLTLLADLADLLLELDDAFEAERHVAVALALQPEDQGFRYRQAVISHRQGDLAQARALLDELVAQGVDEPGVRFERGRVQFAQGDFAQALQTLQPLCDPQALDELRPMSTFLSVRSLHQLNQLPQAIQLAESALQRGPDPALSSALATLYLDAERSADAARLYGQAEAQGQLNSELLAVGGYVALGEGDLAVAQARFKASLAATPHAGRAHLGLGLSYATLGDLPQACTALEAAAQTMPSHLGTWHALAWMRLLAKDLDAAQAAFETALEADHNFGETHGGLAIVALMRGDEAAAQGLIRTGQKLDPTAFNVAAASLLLAEPGQTLGSPQFQERAFQLLNDQVLSQDPHLRLLFDKLVRSRQQNLH